MIRFFTSLLITSLLTGSLIAQSDPASQTTTLEIEFATADYDFSQAQKKVYLSGPIIITTDTLQVTCDKAEVLTSRQGSETTSTQTNIGAIDYILATGNVILKQGNSEAHAGRMEIFPTERKLVLEENPKMIDPYGSVSGHRIIFLEGERRIKIESGGEQPRSTIQINEVEEVGFLMGEEGESSDNP